MAHASAGQSVVASPPRGGLRRVLVEMGAISPEGLEAALERRREEGGRLGEILVTQGKRHSRALADGLAMRLNVPRARLGAGVDRAVVDLLDERTRRRYGVVPLAVETDGALLLATADPADVLALDDLRLLPGREVRPALALPAEIDALLRAGDVHADNFLSGLVREAAPGAGGGPGDLGDPAAIDGGSAPVVRMVGSVISRAVQEEPPTCTSRPSPTRYSFAAAWTACCAPPRPSRPGSRARW